MRQIGRVVKTEKNRVRVRVERIAACRGCGACGRDIQTEEFFAHGIAKAGDVVWVERNEERARKNSPYAYPLNALGLVLGAVVGGVLGKGKETWTVLGGMLGLALSVPALKLPVFKKGVKGITADRVVSVNDPENVREISEEGVCPKALSWSDGE